MMIDRDRQRDMCIYIYKRFNLSKTSDLKLLNILYIYIGYI